MHFNLTMMREFFKFFRRSENEAEAREGNSVSSKQVGEIRVVSPKGIETFELAVTQDHHNDQNTAWMVKTVQGKFMVIFHIDYFIKQIYSHNMNGLYAVVAHEIGHYLCDHFEGSCAAVDIRPEVQEFFFQRYQQNKTEANEIAYMRSVFFALLKGGVIIREFEADLMALRFVPLADLVHIHSQDFASTKNIFTVVEKVNRLRRLNQYTEAVEINKEGYGLFIELMEIAQPAIEEEKQPTDIEVHEV